MVTERDMRNRVITASDDPDATRLEPVMIVCPQTVFPLASALDVLRAMHDGGVRHLPWSTRAAWS